ncbi:hypothetical protein [Streptomyces sp. NRRL B-24484]|uniref:hypothetical protein n=1 Tax=Streptomyces sp. NRRL B-24484 TaxID=1463833 RepID=UPI0004C13DAF|nr:hypothetical protein [Streptomyces sp. NRRL B-24484]
MLRPGTRDEPPAGRLPHRAAGHLGPGRLRLLDLVEEAAADGREEFHPLQGLPADDRRQIVTLPPTIAKLTAVRRLGLVDACSRACVAALPTPPEGYVRGPHTGGPTVRQPVADHWLPRERRRPVRRGSRIEARTEQGETP